jgi:hypothetical protein
MSKTNPERVEDAARVIADSLTGGWEQRMTAARAVARRALEAADRPRPVWPTDESVDAYEAAVKCGANVGECLRDAMLTDPIIRAAIALRLSGGGAEGTGSVIDAVNRAGLAMRAWQAENPDRVKTPD